MGHVPLKHMRSEVVANLIRSCLRSLEHALHAASRTSGKGKGSMHYAPPQASIDSMAANHSSLLYTIETASSCNIIEAIRTFRFKP